MKRTWAVILLILIFGTACLGGAVTHAEKDSPITMTIEPDPDCQLTEAGEMSYLRFTLKNDSEETYTLTRAVLSGELLSQALAFEEDIVLEAKEVKEFKVKKLAVPLSAFDRELTFTLSWQEVYYLEEDPDKLFPLYTERKAEATVVIERFSEPVLELSYKTREELVAVGEQVEITYVLENNTKFDMTGLSLYDPSVSTGYIPLDTTELKAGEKMEVPYTFPMGEVDVVVNPCVEYTVKGEKQLATSESTYTIRYLKVELRLEVQQYPSTEDGTLFAITVTNTGTHGMKNIQLFDEIGTELEESFDLSAGQSKSITYTIAAAVSADSPRMVSFHLTAKDYLEKAYTLATEEAYEVKPYVASEQVNLQLIVTLTQSRFNEDGTLLARVLFEIRNYSSVPITKGLLTENSAFNGTVREYEQLNQGVITFYKDFTVTEEASVLSFVLTAQDPAGNSYATEQMILDMTSLLQRKQEESSASGNSQTIDTTGTIYDTEKYARIFRRVLLIFFVLIVLLLAGSAILYVYERSILSALPPEREETTTSPTGKNNLGDTDVARLQLGYVQPVKLRYMENLDTESQEPAGEETLSEPDAPLVIQTPPPSRRAEATMRFQRPLRTAESRAETPPEPAPAPEMEDADSLFRRPEPQPEEAVEPEPAVPEPEPMPVVAAEPEPVEVQEPEALVLPSNAVQEENAPATEEKAPVSMEEAPIPMEEEVPRPVFVGRLQGGEPAVKAPAVLTTQGKKVGAPRSMELRPRPQVQPREPVRPLRMGEKKDSRE